MTSLCNPSYNCFGEVPASLRGLPPAGVQDGKEELEFTEWFLIDGGNDRIGHRRNLIHYFGCSDRAFGGHLEATEFCPAVQDQS